MPHPRLGLLTLSALCLSILAVGLIAENLDWLADLKVVVQRSPARFPSSQVVPTSEFARARSVLSVYTEARYLDDPEIGLLTNPLQVGRDWEHPATVSYFDNGELLFASSIGLRLHGGKSRTGSPVQSFRLYFRRGYGSAQFRPGTLFDGKGDPLERLIVHNDLRMDQDGSWWHLVNPLAFDIARQIGALAPETRPAAFVLNGEPQGLYVLTEHLRDPFLESRFGHDNFERADDQLRRYWMSSELSRRAPFTAADLSSWIDIESLSRWFVSVIFCATTDPFQGQIFRDETQPNTQWFWVNWDMDHSFMDLYGYLRFPWRHDTFKTTLGVGSFESRVLTQLINPRPGLPRVSCLDVSRRAQLSTHTGFSRQRGIGTTGKSPSDTGWKTIGISTRLGSFWPSVPDQVRRLMIRHLALDPLVRLRLEGRPGEAFQLDGHAVPPDFMGGICRGRRSRCGSTSPAKSSHTGS